MVRLSERNESILGKLKPILTIIIIMFIMVLLSLASLLSFISMCFIVTLFFVPTITYMSPIVFPIFMALFLFGSQLIPGYFSIDKKYMYITLIFSAALVGVLFTLMNPIKGPIYATACVLGNYIGFYLREKHR